MAYGLKYFLDYKNFFGEASRLELKKRDYSGASFELEGAADPFHTNLKDDGDYKFRPIKGSEADIFLLANDGFSLDEIYNSDEREYLVEHFVEGALKWRGFVIPDQCSEPFKAGRYLVKIKATDALGTLKGIPYVAADGSAYTAKQTWLEVLVNCLAKTDLGLALSTCVNTYEVSQPTGLNDDPLTQTKIDPARYRDANGTPFNCYDVLTAVLNQYNAELKQAQGRFNVTDVDDKNQPTLRRRYYSASGVFQSAAEVSNTRTVSHRGDVQLINGDGGTRKDRTYKRVEAYYQYGFYTSVLLNGSFQGWNGTTFPNWTKNGALVLDQSDYETVVRGETVLAKRLGAYITSAFNAADFLKSDPIAIVLSDTLTFTGKLVTFRDNEARVRIRLGEYYLKNDGTWTKEASYISLYPATPDRPVWYEMAAVWEITSAPAPVGGNAYIEVYGAVKTTYAGASGWVNYHTLEIKKNQGNKASKTALGEVYSIEQRGKFTYIPDRILLLHGDAISEAALDGNRPTRAGDSSTLVVGTDRKTSNIYKADGVTITEKWNRYGKVDEKPLAMIVARKVLNNYQRPLNIFEGTFLAPDLDPLQTFVIDGLPGQKFMVLSGSYNHAKGSARLVLVEVTGADVVADEYIYSDFEGKVDGKGGVSSPSTSGTSGGGVTGASGGRQTLQEVTEEGATTDRTITVGGVLVDTVLGLPGAKPLNPVAGKSYLWIGNEGTPGTAPVIPLTQVFFTDIKDFAKKDLYTDGQLIRYNGAAGKFENWLPDFLRPSNLAGYATEAWVSGQGFLKAITSALVVGALGFTPYNADVNAKGFLVASALNGYATESWVNTQGFLKSYTETDTLDSVVARGAVTDKDVTVNAKLAALQASFPGTLAIPTAKPAAPEAGKSYVWISNDGTPGGSNPVITQVSFQDIIDFGKVGTYTDGQLIKYNAATGKFENWTPNFTVDLSNYYTKAEGDGRYLVADAAAVKTFLGLGSAAYKNVGANQGAAWGYIPEVKADGVMEIGKYIDFTDVSGSGLDYTWRLSTAAGGLHISGKGTIYTTGHIAQMKTDLGLGSNAYSSTAYLPLAGGTTSGDVTFERSATGIGRVNIGSSANYLFGDANGLQIKSPAIILSGPLDGTTAAFTGVISAASGSFSRSTTTAYTATAYNSAAQLAIFTGNAANSYAGIRFTAGSAHEAFLGTVQNSSGHAELVWQSYNGSYGERFRVNSGGGISATSATFKGTTAYNAVIIDSTGTTGGGYLGLNCNGVRSGVIGVSGAIEGSSTKDLGIFAESGRGMIFYTGGSTAIKAHITADGRFGIGTGSPASLLELNNGTTNVQATVTTPLGLNSYSQLVLGHGSTYFGASDVRWQIQSIGKGAAVANGADLKIQYWSGTTYTEYLRIVSNGFVGIGTTVPAHKFDVNLLHGQGAQFASPIAAGEWNHLTLGYTERNGAYEKVRLITQRLDNAARADLHFCVNTVVGSTSASMSDSRLKISGTTGHVHVTTGLSIPTARPANPEAGKAYIWIS